ncbi:MAG: metal ABC transporter permease [candidate division FCPU426 bacterium]
MNQALTLFAAPFAMCLVLAGMHCYLGIHVLKRGVIFIDLSLAQVAALGYTLALLLGLPGYPLALCGTFLAAGLFALARHKGKNISQEALIGIVYALGSAAVVLVADKMAHGAEDTKELLVGQILFVTWKDVAITASIYSGVGLVHYLLRRPFLRLSDGEKGLKHAARFDFLFYALFGLVITSSVRVAGVLLVFTYLIVPAFLGNVFFSSVRSKLFFGWALGFLLSFGGLALSYFLDLPSGATVVVLFTLLPVSLVLFKKAS